MRELRLSALALVLGLSASCGSAGSAQVVHDTAAAEQDIVGGSLTSAYPAVGLLFNTRDAASLAGSVCTATVVAPHTLLTAAHCVLAPNPAGSGDLPQLATPAGLFFYPVADARVVDRSQLMAVSGISVPPSFNFTRFIATMGTSTFNNDDIALVTLTDAAPVAPLPILARGLTQADVGSAVTLIGYGSTGPVAYSGPRQKRSTGSRITKLSSTLLNAGSTTQGVCSGDSGGPVLMNGSIVALTQAGQTSGPNGNCIGGDVFTRVDVWSGFVAPGIAADSAYAVTGAAATGAGTGAAATGAGSGAAVAGAGTGAAAAGAGTGAAAAGAGTGVSAVGASTGASSADSSGAAGAADAGAGGG